MRNPLSINRRHFFGKSATGLGSLALSSMLTGLVQIPGPKKSLAPKAKRIIYLFQSGGPSQLDLFDYKPLLNKKNGEQLPDFVRDGQRLTGMSSHQTSIPLAGSAFQFKQYGKSGAWVSELMPKTSEIVDDICFVKSMYTEAINHDPAVTFFRPVRRSPGDHPWDPGSVMD